MRRSRNCMQSGHDQHDWQEYILRWRIGTPSSVSIIQQWKGAMEEYSWLDCTRPICGVDCRSLGATPFESRVTSTNWRWKQTFCAYKGIEFMNRYKWLILGGSLSRMQELVQTTCLNNSYVNYFFADVMWCASRRHVIGHKMYSLIAIIFLSLSNTKMRDRQHQELQLYFIIVGLDTWKSRFVFMIEWWQSM